LPQGAYLDCYGLDVHSAPRTPRNRYRRWLQLAAAALAAAVVTVIVLILRQLFGTPDTAGSPAPPPGGSAGPIARSAPQPRGSPLSPDWRGDGKTVTLAFGGDVHFEGPLSTRLAADPATALDTTFAKLLSGADLAMTNFESALVNGPCPDPQSKQYVFDAPPAAITAFRSAGISVVSEANNHGEDCGQTGLMQSLAIARAAHFPVIGIGRDAAQAFAPYRTVIDGQRISIVAATEVLDSDLRAAWTATATQPGLASAYQEGELVAAVQAARRTSDTVAVFLHWGTETQPCPNAIQEPLARALVKAGADIVVGTHAHVQLGAGYLGSALVDYGLGNLAFYDTKPPETYSGMLVVSVTGRHIDGFRWRPALIESGLPVPLAGAAAAAAVRRWEGLRGCTDLSLTPAPSRATTRTESIPFTGPSVAPQADADG
jgi:hypothetical protein